jgi:hypothetical protein
LFKPEFDGLIWIRVSGSFSIQSSLLTRNDLVRSFSSQSVLYSLPGNIEVYQVSKGKDYWFVIYGEAINQFGSFGFDLVRVSVPANSDTSSPEVIPSIPFIANSNNQNSSLIQLAGIRDPFYRPLVWTYISSQKSIVWLRVSGDFVPKVMVLRRNDLLRRFSMEDSVSVVSDGFRAYEFEQGVRYWIIVYSQQIGDFGEIKLELQYPIEPSTSVEPVRTDTPEDGSTTSYPPEEVDSGSTDPPISVGVSYGNNSPRRASQIGVLPYSFSGVTVQDSSGVSPRGLSGLTLFNPRYWLFKPEFDGLIWIRVSGAYSPNVCLLRSKKLLQGWTKIDSIGSSNDFVIFEVEQGVKYWIGVFSQRKDAFGLFSLDVLWPRLSVNSDISKAIEVSVLPFFFKGGNGNTSSTGLRGLEGVFFRSLFWSYSPISDQIIWVNVKGNFDMRFAVLTRNRLGSFSKSLSILDVQDGYQAFDVLKDSRYWLLVYGASASDFGDLEVNIRPSDNSQTIPHPLTDAPAITVAPSSTRPDVPPLDVITNRVLPIDPEMTFPVSNNQTTIPSRSDASTAPETLDITTENPPASGTTRVSGSEESRKANQRDHFLFRLGAGVILIIVGVAVVALVLVYVRRNQAQIQQGQSSELALLQT